MTIEQGMLALVRRFLADDVRLFQLPGAKSRAGAHLVHRNPRPWPEGLAARRRVSDEITAFMLNVLNSGSNPPLSRDTAVIGGINELVLHAIETGRVERLQSSWSVP